MMQFFHEARYRYYMIKKGWQETHYSLANNNKGELTNQVNSWQDTSYLTVTLKMNKAQVVESHEQVKRDSYSSLGNTHRHNHIQLNYICMTWLLGPNHLLSKIISYESEEWSLQ